MKNLTHGNDGNDGNDQSLHEGPVIGQMYDSPTNHTSPDIMACWDCLPTHPDGIEWLIPTASPVVYLIEIIQMQRDMVLACLLCFV